MHDWNTVVTVHKGGFRNAIDLLTDFGPISGTDYFNVLVMHVDDAQYMLERLTSESVEDSRIFDTLARVVPATETIDFHTAEEFERKAKEVVVTMAPLLSGKGFHVRMHRRGFKGRLSSTDEERFLDRVLIECLEEASLTGKIIFDNSDAILAIETVGQRAGFSLWSRDQLARYPLLGLK